MLLSSCHLVFLVLGRVDVLYEHTEGQQPGCRGKIFVKLASPPLRFAETVCHYK
jgi:hypothetical protein